MPHHYNLPPDPPDATGSHQLLDLVGSSTGFADWSLECDVPTNQDPTSTCYAHAFANAIAQAGRKNGPFERPSQLLIADMARGILGLRGTDVGCSLAATDLAIRTAGFAPESVLPWDPAKLNEPITVDQYQDAICQYGMRSHRLVNNYQSGIVAAVKAHCGAVISFDVDQPFEDLDAVEIWDGLRGEKKGSHALSVCATASFGAKIMNSWGEDWCRDGFAWVSWNVIRRANSVWIVDIVPEYS